MASAHRFRPRVRASDARRSTRFVCCPPRSTGKETLRRYSDCESPVDTLTSTGRRRRDDRPGPRRRRAEEVGRVDDQARVRAARELESCPSGVLEGAWETSALSAASSTRHVTSAPRSPASPRRLRRARVADGTRRRLPATRTATASRFDRRREGRRGRPRSDERVGHGVHCRPDEEGRARDSPPRRRAADGRVRRGVERTGESGDEPALPGPGWADQPGIVSADGHRGMEAAGRDEAHGGLEDGRQRVGAGDRRTEVGQSAKRFGDRDRGAGNLSASQRAARRARQHDLERLFELLARQRAAGAVEEEGPAPRRVARQEREGGLGPTWQRVARRRRLVTPGRHRTR